MALKATLTPTEKVSAAFHVLVRGMDTQDVASILGVNYGRVSEACSAIKQALDWPRDIREEAGAAGALGVVMGGGGGGGTPHTRHGPGGVG